MEKRDVPNLEINSIIPCPSFIGLFSTNNPSSLKKESWMVVVVVYLAAKCSHPTKALKGVGEREGRGAARGKGDKA